MLFAIKNALPREDGGGLFFAETGTAAIAPVQ